MYNATIPSLDCISLNLDQILTTRQTKFLILKSNKHKVGLNILPNCFLVLNIPTMAKSEHWYVQNSHKEIIVVKMITDRALNAWILISLFRDQKTRIYNVHHVRKFESK